MKLEDLGYNEELQIYRKEKALLNLSVGRVSAVHKERYVVITAEMEADAEILGNLRFSVQSKSDLPCVGDWVVISQYDENKVIIHSVLPRKSLLERRSVGKNTEKQIIAANIDTAMIVLAVDRDFSINRIERYLTICYNSKIEPLIVLSKTDLIDNDTLNSMIKSIEDRIKNIPIIPISNQTKKGIELILERIKKGKTYCLLGSSGVGKSSILNSIAGRELMKTASISTHSNRGRHMTTHRELTVLEKGGIFIDNPGIREVGITDSSEGVNSVFESIIGISKKCRYKDCSHTKEKGCAVIKAVENGEIDQDQYENYLRLEKEKEHFQRSLFEKRKKEKDFGKMIKNYKKGKYKL